MDSMQQPQGIPPTPILPDEQQIGRKRPKAATVIGILLLVFAVLNILLFPVNTRAAVALHVSATMRHFTIITIMVMTLLDLVMGFGLLRIVCWARKGTICIPILQLVYEIIYGSYRIFISPAQTYAHHILTAVVFIFFIILYGVELFLFTYFLTRPNVIEAFEGEQTAVLNNTPQS